MNSNEMNNTNKDSADGGFISFSNDNSSSNWRKTPFKSFSPHQNRYEQFSPHGSPQGFSSPIHNQRNFHGNRRQSGNSYGDRFRGNQSYNRGNNRNNRSDNRKPYHNRSVDTNDSTTFDISDYFHPSMIQDPWKHFQLNSSKSSPIIDTNCHNNTVETQGDEPSSSSNT